MPPASLPGTSILSVIQPDEPSATKLSKDIVFSFSYHINYGVEPSTRIVRLLWAFLGAVSRLQTLILFSGFEFYSADITKSSWLANALMLRPFLTYQSHRVLLWVTVCISSLAYILLCGIGILDVFANWSPPKRLVRLLHVSVQDMYAIHALFVFLPVLSCNKPSSGPSVMDFFLPEGLECRSQQGHLTTSIILTTFTCFFWLLNTFFSADFRRPSPHLFAVEWTRYSVLCVLMKLLLIMKIVFLRQNFAGAAAIQILCSMAFLGATLYYLPFHNHSINYLQSALGVLCVSAAISFIAGYAWTRTLDSAASLYAFLILLLPLLFLGFFLCYARGRRVLVTLDRACIIEDAPLFARVQDVFIASRLVLKLNSAIDDEQDPIESYFTLAVKQFPDTAAVLISSSAYAFEQGNIPLCLSHLQKARTCRIPIDVSYVIAVLERLRKDDQVAYGEENLDVQKLLSAAATFEVRTRMKIRRFWSLVREDHVNLSRLPEAVDAIERSRTRTLHLYNHLLKKMPNSHRVLRQYATFLQEFEHDYDGAARLWLRAEQAEEVQSSHIKTMASVRGLSVASRRKSVGVESSKVLNAGPMDFLRNPFSERPISEAEWGNFGAALEINQRIAGYRGSDDGGSYPLNKTDSIKSNMSDMHRVPSSSGDLGATNPNLLSPLSGLLSPTQRLPEFESRPNPSQSRRSSMEQVCKGKASSNQPTTTTDPGGPPSDTKRTPARDAKLDGRRRSIVDAPFDPRQPSQKEGRRLSGADMPVAAYEPRHHSEHHRSSEKDSRLEGLRAAKVDAPFAPSDSRGKLPSEQCHDGRHMSGVAGPQHPSQVGDESWRHSGDDGSRNVSDSEARRPSASDVRQTLLTSASTRGVRLRTSFRIEQRVPSSNHLAGDTEGWGESDRNRGGHAQGSAVQLSTKELARRRYYKERISAGKTFAMRRLSVAIFVTLLLLLVNAAAFYTLSRLTIDQFIADVDHIRLPNRLQSSVVGISFAARSAQASAVLEDPYPYTFDETKLWIAAHTSDLEDALSTLYYSQPDGVPADALAEWETRNVRLEEFEPLSSNIFLTSTSPLDGLGRLGRASKEILGQSAETLAGDALRSDVFRFVTVNCLWNFLPHTAVLASAYLDSLVKGITQFRVSIYILFFGSYSLLFVVAASTFYPTIREIVRERTSVMRLFSEIPKGTVDGIIRSIQLGRSSAAGSGGEEHGHMTRHRLWTEEDEFAGAEADVDFTNSNLKRNDPIRRMIVRIAVAICICLSLSLVMFIMCAILVGNQNALAHAGYNAYQLPQLVNRIGFCAQEKMVNLSLHQVTPLFGLDILDPCLTQALQEFSTRFNALRFGTPDYRAVQSGSEASTVLYTSRNCRSSPSSTWPCESLNALLQEYVENATRVLLTNQEDPHLDHVTFQSFYGMLVNGMHPGSPLQVLLAELITYMTGTDTIRAELDVVSAIFGLMLPCLLFTYVVLLKPAIVGLRRENERTMSMLLMIPLEVIDRVAAIRDFLLTGQARDMKTQLQETKAQTTSILQAAVDAVIVCDQQGFIQVFNPAAERMLKYNRDEAFGMSIQTMLPTLVGLFSPATASGQSSTGAASKNSSIVGPAVPVGTSSLSLVPQAFEPTLLGRLKGRLKFTAGRVGRALRFRRDDQAGSDDEGKGDGEAGEMIAVRKNDSKFPATVSIGRGSAGGKSFFVIFIRDITEEKKQERELADEKRRSDRLLLNILPPPVAERLKAGERVIADLIDEATVLFSDIVGFTSMTSNMAPDEVVLMLSDIFLRFDNLLDCFRLEKVKTIGDCYMCYTTQPPEVMVNFALAMISAVQDINKDHSSTLQVRIGLNTGTVIAGVLGTSRLAYDIWGDSVNMAARMEQTGLPGCIQVSQSTYERIKWKFEFEERTGIQVKGKGTMNTYIVLRRRPLGVALKQMQKPPSVSSMKSARSGSGYDTEGFLRDSFAGSPGDTGKSRKNGSLSPSVGPSKPGELDRSPEGSISGTPRDTPLAPKHRSLNSRRPACLTIAPNQSDAVVNLAK